MKMLKLSLLLSVVLFGVARCQYSRINHGAAKNQYSLKGIEATISTGMSNKPQKVTINSPTDIEEAYEILIEDPKLKKLNKDSFKSLPKLDVLTITNGALEDIEPEAFVDLPALRNIILTGNKIQAIQDNIFNGLTVRKINLTYNIISKIYGNAFDDLPNLKVVELSHNNLSSYNNNWFRACPVLYRIIINSNLLEELPSHMLKSFKQRDSEAEDLELWLINNKIKKIAADAFVDVKKVRDLWLSMNQIENIDKNTFKGLTIESLDLDKNNINCLSKETMMSIKVKDMDIDRNPIDCNCLREMRKWSKGQDNFVKTTGRAMECMQKKITELLANADNVGKVKPLKEREY